MALPARVETDPADRAPAPERSDGQSLTHGTDNVIP